MRLLHINPNGSEWKWFHIPGLPLEVEIELKLATLREAQELPPAGANAGVPHRRFIAERFFRDFRGLEDAAGNPLANTIEHRIALLEDMRIFRFVGDTLARAEAWMDAEKKGGASG